MKNQLHTVFLLIMLCFRCAGSNGSKDSGMETSDTDSIEIPADTIDTEFNAADNTGDPADYQTADSFEASDEINEETCIEIFDVFDIPADNTGSDQSEGEIPSVQPLLFDMKMIADSSTAQCIFYGHKTALKNLTQMDVWKVSYYSWESVDGELKPILIRGYAAKPANLTEKIPGIVLSHGLGGFSEESNAVDTAELLNMFVLAYTGPGGGSSPENTSEGLPAEYKNFYRLFDTIPDLRGSWFWGHAVAAMRGITCLENRSDIDKNKLGITGFSAGGVASLTAAGADDRIKAAVPLSGTGAWGLAVLSPDAWENNLLAVAEMTKESPQWLKLLEFLDPAAVVKTSKAKIMMFDGSTDEFFPMTSFAATFNAIPDSDKRLTIAANFDHGCYSVSGVESEKTIEERASIRIAGGSRMWFRHWFSTDSDYQNLPQAPAVQLNPSGNLMVVTALVDEYGYDIEEVVFWISNDDSYSYVSTTLEKSGTGLYTKIIPNVLQTNSIYFADVLYKTKKLLFPDKFSISSLPVIPEGLIPHIRGYGSCM
jgi:cephalosporin-C deacetylase-like acetyl esterase